MNLFCWQVPDECQDSERQGREAFESLDRGESLEGEAKKESLNRTLATLAKQEMKDGQNVQTWDLMPWLLLYVLLALLPGELSIQYL